ncbi:rRNA methyltransferase [Pseudomonas oryzihabitans]|nr:rRNA methyltransferase [Pseudomonas psychrotolerans]
MKFDDIKKLHQKKYRAEFGHFLVEGEHLALELQKAALQNPQLQRAELYVTAAYEHWQSPFRTHLVSDRQMAQLADTKTPQGIIAVVPMPSAAPAPVAGERAVYLHEIQDPGNLGTILRTLAWFGGFRCLLSPGSVDPYNPKVVRASMGAIFHTPLELDVDLDGLPERFPRLACLDMQGEPVQSAEFKTFDCYLFGNEARGVPRERLATLNAQPFTIGGSGAIESLNLAATVNICAYELSR